MAKNSYIRESIWRSDVNTALGMLFIGSCALWAGLAIIEASWHVNPLSTAFAKALDHEITLPYQN